MPILGFVMPEVGMIDFWIPSEAFGAIDTIMLS